MTVWVRLRFLANRPNWTSHPLFWAVSLGLDENDSTKQNLDVYRSEFEAFFLQATDIYYKAESDAFVSANSVIDYMKKAETRLKEEEDRIELYLHASTRPKVSERSFHADALSPSPLTVVSLQLIGVCENVLVRAHQQLLWDEFQSLLDAEKSDGTWCASERVVGISQSCPCRSIPNVHTSLSCSRRSGPATGNVRGPCEAERSCFY